MGSEEGNHNNKQRRSKNNPRNRQRPTKQKECRKTLFVLHGSRQTGQLLLGRMAKLRKALQQIDIQLVAPDGPLDHPEDANLRQWWDRDGNTYQGLETSLQMLQDLWDSAKGAIGILGFSQGARLAHLAALLHQQQAASSHNSNIPFAGLQFVIMVAGYDRPVPENWETVLEATGITSSANPPMITTPSLHIWGASDALIPPESSQAIMTGYTNPQSHQHEGGHHVPMKNPSIDAYMDFIKRNCGTVLEEDTGPPNTQPPEAPPKPAPKPPPVKKEKPPPPPDEETAQAQQDEVEALTAIYPEEITVLSKVTMNEDTGENTYQHPISYQIALQPEEDEETDGHWPKHPLALKVQYPHNYPSDEALPNLQLVHENNVMEFPSVISAACMRAVQEAAEAERGMPCVLSCFLAAKEFLDSGVEVGEIPVVEEEQGEEEVEQEDEDSGPTLLKQASPERIQECNLEGLAIAEALLERRSPEADDSTPLFSGKGGSWAYTIGLVGKPSAGKSTLFNSASGFARQRDDADNALGGAAMAARPFTTIDPNLGFSLVPAPEGSCPDENGGAADQLNIGCSHGRDAKGRRLLPILLKDVAGLVPGAYQGRGRGNKFLNDLTDADVLVHVVDSSGTADSEGNCIGEDNEGEQKQSQPLEDLAWVRNELCEWVFNNLIHKWEAVKRKGRSKLSGMFSGYGQTSAFVAEVLSAVERHMEETEQRDHALDNLDEWDTGDVHRLVSAFLGVRFPMALALNKYDLPSSAKHVDAIQSALPVHGAYVGVPLCARSEMSFIRHHMLQQANKEPTAENATRKVPLGTWQCLQSAISLREPVLVFPVSDMTTYQPLPGLLKQALGDPSLPSPGMVACLEASGGSMPTLWDPAQQIYANSGGRKQACALRDVLLMKPGSTVEDVFMTLKRLGALAGEFVRAEGAGDLGETSKQIKKDSLVSRRCCILKIMTTKRTQWQQQNKS